MRNRILAKLRTPDGNINPWVIAITVTLATFMEVLDTSIANVAIPHISGNLSASADESTWVLTSYLVSNAIVLPLSGWMSSLIGRKRFYMSCVALFTVSSFLCGLAPSLGILVLCRILQGVGGGGLQPSEQAILNDTFPLEKRGMAFAVHGTSELAFTGAAAGLLVANNPVVGAFGGALVVATTLGALAVKERERDTTIGVVLVYCLICVSIHLLTMKITTPNKIRPSTNSTTAIKHP